MGNKAKIIELFEMLHDVNDNVPHSGLDDALELCDTIIEDFDVEQQAEESIQDTNAAHEYYLKVYRELIEGAIATEKIAHTTNFKDCVKLHIDAYRAACGKFNEGDD